MSSILCMIMILNGVGVIYSESEIYSIMHLVNLLCTLGVVLIYNGLDYVGILMILVYVGAIGVLFLFVIMMIEVKEEGMNMKMLYGILCLIWISIVWNMEWNEDLLGLVMEGNVEILSILDEGSVIRCIGESMYDGYIECLLIIGLILLLCLIGCVEIVL